MSVSLGMFSELCAAQGITPSISLVGIDGAELPKGMPDLRNIERGDFIGTMYAAYGFLSSMASNPAIPDGTAYACNVMANALYDSAVAFETGGKYGD